MKVSFVIPAHQSAAWLPHAAESAQKQTYPDTEIIVVDDCSTDSTPKYLEWLQKKDKRVKVIRNERNMGRSASRNIGNAAATGDIILVLDADDLATPQRAKLTVEKIKKGADFVYGSADVIDALGFKLAFVQADAFNYKKALETKRNGIVHSSVGYTKEFSKRFPYADGEISKLGIDDWHQQIRAAASGAKIDFSPSVLAVYRHLQGSISNSRDEKEVQRVKDEFLKTLAVAA